MAVFRWPRRPARGRSAAVGADLTGRQSVQRESGAWRRLPSLPPAATAVPETAEGPHALRPTAHALPPGPLAHTATSPSPPQRPCPPRRHRQMPASPSRQASTWPTQHASVSAPAVTPAARSTYPCKGGVVGTHAQVVLERACPGPIPPTVINTRPTLSGAVAWGAHAPSNRRSISPVPSHASMSRRTYGTPVDTAEQRLAVYVHDTCIIGAGRARAGSGGPHLHHPRWAARHGRRPRPPRPQVLVQGQRRRPAATAPTGGRHATRRQLAPPSRRSRPAPADAKTVDPTRCRHEMAPGMRMSMRLVRPAGCGGRPASRRRRAR
jgi:hypothetical protein